MIANKYSTSQLSAISHFINDVKYVTISLNKDRRKLFNYYREEILEIDIASVKERFAANYQPIVSQFNQEIHKEVSYNKRVNNRELLLTYQKRIEHLQMKLSQLIELKVPCIEAYQHDPRRCLLDLYEINQPQAQIGEPIQPTDLWFHIDKYDEIRNWMDEVQTRIEDLLHAQKRIYKVWKEEILEEKYDELIRSYQNAKGGNFKFLNANFWKVRKQIRELFIEDMSLLTEAEIERLDQNRAILKENTLWLKQNEKKIVNILGSAYQGYNTLFEALRKQYEAFYQILLRFETVSLEEIIELLQLCFHLELLPHLKQINLVDLYQVCEERKQVLSNLMRDYEFFHDLRLEKKEALGFDEIRNTIYLIERIQSKMLWLKEKEEEIQKVFGQTRLSMKTNWDQYQKKALQTECSLDFVDYEPYERKDQDSLTSEEIFYQILEKEQPIHQKLLLKRLASVMNAPRITALLKKEFLLMLQNLKPEYECIEEFIEKVEKQSIVFRKSTNEKRDINYVSESELKVGILAIIESKNEVILDEISKDIAKLLGYPRRNQTLNQRVEEAVKRLKREQKIARFSGGWRRISE